MFKLKQLVILALSVGFIVQLQAATQNASLESNPQQAQSAIQQKTVPQQPVASQLQQTKVQTMDQVSAAIANAKLGNIKSIEMDDGLWEVKTLVNNVETKYSLDPAGNTLTKVGQEREDDNYNPPADTSGILQAVKSVQNQGLTFKEIEFKGNSWKVEATTPQGAEQNVYLSADGKQILHSSLDD